MNDEDREAVVSTLALEPEAGIVIPGGGGVRKVRIPLQGRGKRGGARVIARNEKENISSADLARLAVLAKAIVKEAKSS